MPPSNPLGARTRKFLYSLPSSGSPNRFDSSVHPWTHSVPPCIGNPKFQSLWPLQPDDRVPGIVDIGMERCLILDAWYGRDNWAKSRPSRGVKGKSRCLIIPVIPLGHKVQHGPNLGPRWARTAIAWFLSNQYNRRYNILNYFR